ncbi:hypothetical protein FOZ62_028751, partial [Perkinsus olseni]
MRSFSNFRWLLMMMVLLAKRRLLRSAGLFRKSTSNSRTPCSSGSTWTRLQLPSRARLGRTTRSRMLVLSDDHQSRSSNQFL